MYDDTMFLYMIAALALAYAVGSAYGFFLKRTRSTETEGVVHSIQASGSGKMRFRQSRLARISYRVGGKKYISSNQIPVPASAKVGSKITVRYDTVHPDTLYCFSWTKIGIALAISLVVFAIAFLA